jgi:hypothetical protein
LYHAHHMGHMIWRPCHSWLAWVRDTRVHAGPIVLPQVLGLHSVAPGHRRAQETHQNHWRPKIKQWQRWWGSVAPQGLGTRVCECGTSPNTVV